MVYTFSQTHNNASRTATTNIQYFFNSEDAYAKFLADDTLPPVAKAKAKEWVSDYLSDHLSDYLGQIIQVNYLTIDGIVSSKSMKFDNLDQLPALKKTLFSDPIKDRSKPSGENENDLDGKRILGVTLFSIKLTKTPASSSRSRRKKFTFTEVPQN